MMNKQVGLNKCIEKKDVFFLGLMYSDKTLEEAETYSKAGIQMAPHIFQENLLMGFANRRDVSLKVIHVPPIGSYPIHYKKALMHTNKWKDCSRMLLIWFGKW